MPPGASGPWGAGSRDVQALEEPPGGAATAMPPAGGALVTARGWTVMHVFPFQGGEQARVCSGGAASTQLLLRRGQLTAPAPWPPCEQTWQSQPRAWISRASARVCCQESRPRVERARDCCPQSLSPAPATEQPLPEEPGQTDRQDRGSVDGLLCVSCLQGVFSWQVTFGCVSAPEHLAAGTRPCALLRGRGGKGRRGGRLPRETGSHGPKAGGSPAAEKLSCR